jgi:histidine transport system permease protein
VPDLVLMLLIFYGLQIALNSVTDALGMAQFDIDPMAGDYYAGLYLRRLFYGNLPRRFLAVPKGHIEAATALALAAGRRSGVFCSRR